MQATAKSVSPAIFYTTKLFMAVLSLKNDDGSHTVLLREFDNQIDAVLWADSKLNGYNVYDIWKDNEKVYSVKRPDSPFLNAAFDFIPHKLVTGV